MNYVKVKNKRNRKNVLTGTNLVKYIILPTLLFLFTACDSAHSLRDLREGVENEENRQDMSVRLDNNSESVFTETTDIVEDVPIKIEEDMQALKNEPDAVEGISDEHVIQKGADYASLYLEKIGELHSNPTLINKFMLVNVNDDDIPELVIYEFSHEPDSDGLEFIEKKIPHLFTIHEDTVDELEIGEDHEDIATLDIFEGENLVRVSYLLGWNLYEDFYRIDQGRFIPVLSMFSERIRKEDVDETDHFDYYINDIKCESDDQLVKQLSEVYSPQGHITEPLTNEVRRLTYKFDDGVIETDETGSEPYPDPEELIGKLARIRREYHSEEFEGENTWKAIYWYYLYSVLYGANCVPNLLDAEYYNPKNPVHFELKDLTNDDIPELFISAPASPYEPDRFSYWNMYTFLNGKLEYLVDFSYYDPEKRKSS